MPRFVLCKRSIGLAAFGLLSACGDDAQDAHRARDAAADAAREIDAAHSADAGGTALITLLRAEVELYDRRVRAICPCEVASGNYKTEKECLDLAVSGSDWAQCAADALADYDSASTRADTQCFTEYLEQTAECTEAAKCDSDKLAVCGVPSSACLAKQSMRLNLILTKCPDFGLLSRLPINEDDRDN
jgi:hypothetical protein